MSLVLDLGQPSTAIVADHPDLARSPVCDMHGHARALEAAYREVFRMWCAGEAEPRP
ncbi:MAG TPA: hypothetical protein VFZ01_01050 [Geminicoccaceae bacterium]